MPDDRQRPQPAARDPVAGEPADAPNLHPADQLLISYLDGELDEPAAAELEARLAEDAPLRNRLHEFQQTWDMLDEVTRHSGDGTFLQSTIEMVVTSATRRRTRWHRWPIRILIGGLAFSLSAIIAFQSVRYFQDQPYRQFLADLEFWENADLYDKVDSIEFVQQLHDSGMFAEEPADER